MKIPHLKRNYFIPIMFAAAAVLSSICFASHSLGTSTALSKGLSLIATPLQSTTKHIYSFCSSIGEYFQGIDKLMDENQRLALENKKLSEENAKVKELKSENDSLYKFLELKKEHTDYKFTNANIISKTSNGYTESFTIDKGSFHGILPNMPIISEDGALVGVTYSVDTSSSRCKSVISYDMNIGVYNENSGETGILSGSFETFSQGKCLIGKLPSTSTIKEGDRILTSGLGNIYPRGLILGTVEKFIPEAGTHSLGAVVKLHESTLSCDNVMIITAFERIYE